MAAPDLREQLLSNLGSGYTFDRELGGGGMSRVFVAEDLRLGRRVVVKVLAPELAAGVSVERFEREIRLAASLQQANIVPVLDAVEEFRLADQLPDGPVDDCTICLPAALGRAFDQANMPDSAIASYERYIATPYAWRFDRPHDPILLAGMHERLGELYEARGDHARAATHYARFIDMWKDADSELQPRVAQARRRLAQLRDSERRG